MEKPLHSPEEFYKDTDPDVVCMLEFQRGNKAAFENLMRKYYKRIFNFVYRFVGNKEAAEDLTQDVFVKIYKMAPSYKVQAKFQTLLYTIAKNTCLNELRKKNRTAFSLDETMESDSGQVKRQWEDQESLSPVALAEQKERAKIVRQAICDLPESQRAAVILLRYDRLSYEEIAGVLHCSVSAVKSLLSRAKENLKNSLSGFNDT